MPVTSQTVSLTADALARVQAALGDADLDGWLLYDFHGTNPIAGRVLGLPPLSRRFFVLLPRDGEPVALTHAIEQQVWEGWIGENRRYLSWQELEEGLAGVLRGMGRVAMEYAPRDAVPYLDRVPAGVLELVREAGVEVVSSAPLVTAFHSRWSDADLASHRRAAAAVRKTALAAFGRAGEAIRAGEPLTEWALRAFVLEGLARRGVPVASDAIVAIGPNAANPHYSPSETRSVPIRAGDVLLIDCWGKEAEEAVAADQTWMAYMGERLPERASQVWTAVRDAREAAVERIRSAWATGRPVSGGEVDDAARGVIRERGFGDAFIHRTGHSIDREMHGSGPNIDNLETRDERLLVPGIGFSVEPGIYLAGEIGMRSEVNVFMTEDGPEVTTPGPQKTPELVSVS
jgi:Xaa-Pro dipeptidase